MPHDDLTLAQKAVSGDEMAQESVSAIAHPLIEAQTNVLCKSHCYGFHRRKKCTLFPTWGSQKEDDPLCDLGNQSYSWMLETLVAPKYLKNYEARNDARLKTYFFGSVNSESFFEKWKNMRFERRIYIPEFIKEIAPKAEDIFRWQINKMPVERMAQKSRSLSITEIEDILDRMMAVLTKQKKMYYLHTPVFVSTSGVGSDDDSPETETPEVLIPDDTYNPERMVIGRWVQQALSKLADNEKFVLRAMDMQGLTATELKKHLERLDFSIRKGISPQETTIQQINTLKKKARLSLRRILEKNKKA